MLYINHFVNKACNIFKTVLYLTDILILESIYTNYFLNKNNFQSEIILETTKGKRGKNSKKNQHAFW